MGNSTHAKIFNVGNTAFSTNSKVLRLSNVLHVPNIHKNLLFVSQFMCENNFFLISSVSLPGQGCSDSGCASARPHS